MCNNFEKHLFNFFHHNSGDDPVYQCWMVVRDKCELVNRWDDCSPFFSTFDDKEGCLKLLAEIKYCDPDSSFRIDHVNLNRLKSGDRNGGPGHQMEKITWEDLKNARDEAKNDNQ